MFLGTITKLIILLSAFGGLPDDNLNGCIYKFKAPLKETGTGQEFRNEFPSIKRVISDTCFSFTILNILVSTGLGWSSMDPDRILTPIRRRMLPTARGESVRLFHIYAVEEWWENAQCDVPQAFLKSEIDCDIFVYPPRNFAEFSNQLLKLKLSLYGAKQSATLWNKMIDAFLQELVHQKAWICTVHHGSMPLQAM